MSVSLQNNKRPRSSLGVNIMGNTTTNMQYGSCDDECETPLKKRNVVDHSSSSSSNATAPINKCKCCGANLARLRKIWENINNDHKKQKMDDKYLEKLSATLSEYCCFASVIAETSSMCVLPQTSTTKELPTRSNTMFPVRCFSCGKVVSGNERVYEFLHKVVPFHKSRNALILNFLGFTRDCCRRTIITNVSLIDKAIEYEIANELKPENDTSSEFITVMDRKNTKNTVTWRAI